MLLAFDLLLGLLPGFAWLIFYLSEDPHPEPDRLIVLTFFSGIAFAFFTIVIENIFDAGAADVGIQMLSVLSLIGLALIEEIMKFGAAYFAVGKSPELDEPVDRMIYMVVAALGFATLENIGAITNVASGAAPTLTATVGAFFATASMRFVGATLLHSLTSAIVGYQWALGVAKKKVTQYLIAGFGFAALLHASFNYLILAYGNIAYTVVFLLIVGFFVLNDFEKLKAQPAAQ
ncbi:MAG TPA: PrsW family glutamic-type intramembrane protease [Candidatus Paceibacterota bacterium]|nr:PrsW family glutamic-type intramembrane protease [Candidatus Paceibacterota bacterium]